jgi:hypothetical protein
VIFKLGGFEMIEALLKSVVLTVGLFAGTAFAESVDQIVLQRTACYGTCPVYAVTIESDGSVAFEGKEHVRHKGKASSAIPAADWQFLIASLQRTNFFSLKDRYSTKDDGCTTVSTDHPALGITVTRGREQKQVWYYLGCGGPPESFAIAWLADTIDLVVKTRQWVGKEWSSLLIVH